MLRLPEPGHLLHLFLPAFHGILSLIQAVLQVLDRHLQILLHPFQLSNIRLQLLLGVQETGVLSKPKQMLEV
uniref:Si:ch211-158m24.12 n=1 Tax=Hippocampus comes TaxID=109280 RepID=A0A3Q2YPW8_HIPCM